MSKRAEKASFDYQRELGMIDSVSDEHVVARRMGFYDGYKKAEQDILSKITTKHLNGLKWIEKTGITSQPYPYHKYCKNLRITLEKLLSDEQESRRLR